jgi:hypothetical protein
VQIASINGLRTFQRPQPASAVPYSLAKRAILLYRHGGVAKSIYRANARKWIAQMLWLGNKHLLAGAAAKWGRPGEPNVTQIHAPRTMRA